MRQWEYRTFLLHSVNSDLLWYGGWRLRQINEQEIPNWKKTEVFSSVAAYCNYMDEQGWELINADYHDARPNALLLFKRPYTNAMG